MGRQRPEVLSIVLGQLCLVIFSRFHKPRELLCVWPAVAVQTFLSILRDINGWSLAETPTSINSSLIPTNGKWVF